jgi:threonine 3-dehydrogenase
MQLQLEAADSLVKARAEPGALLLDRRPLPALGAQDVLVRVHSAAICGTDLHLYKWNNWASRHYHPPFPLGHEFSGVILEVGAGVTRLTEGERVVAETHLSCGHCEQCRANRRHTCLNLRLFSRLGRGCFCSHTVVPEQTLRKVPEQLDLRVAAIMEPLGVSVRAVMATEIRAARLLVIGCGPIGLFAVAAAKALGAATIVAVDPAPFRRQLAAELGARHTLASLDDEADGSGAGAADFDVAIDASGHPGAIRAGLALLKPGGSLIIASLPSEAVSLDLARHVVLREIVVRGVYGRLIDETWLQVENLLAAGTLDVRPILTHSFPLADYDRAFKTAASGEAGKVLFDFSG